MRGVVFLLAATLWADSRNQVFADFTTPLPLREGDTLVIGIVGGWERWDAEQRITRRICLRLREKKLPGVYVETVENHKPELAHELILKAFDSNKDGALDEKEKSKVRLIVYGQSLGGAAVPVLCRWLAERGIPVRLAIPIDGYTRKAHRIPANVVAAANLYQKDIGAVRGQSKILAEDPRRTKILGNWRFRYPRSKELDLETEPWIRRAFLASHLKMEYDPEVWAKVEGLIVDAYRNW